MASLRPFLQVQQDETLIPLRQDIPGWVPNAADAVVAHTASTFVNLTSGVSRVANRLGQQNGLLETIEQQCPSFLQLLALDTVPTVVIVVYFLKSLHEALRPIHSMDD